MRTELREELIGNSRQVVDLKDEIDRIARSDAKVLVTGETGVGKELVARAIHTGSKRKHRAFIPVNCAGLPENLLESELFGHLKGSFTGAYRDKPGKLELADNGTVFLDEVGEMTLRMQGLLLRFLENGELQKVGADRGGSTVDVRVIAATNRDLGQLIERGEFREDLHYRLNVIHLHVPPLRERRDDIPELVNHFLRYFTRNNGCALREISDEAMAVMVDYAWLGNVRELENIIERLVISCRNRVLTVADLPSEFTARRGIAFRPARERRRTVADGLYKRIVEDRESFWAVVYPLYMHRDITRTNVREVLQRGLEQSKGNYRIVTRLFNMEDVDYKKFVNFLRKHRCLLPYKEFRQ